MEVVPKLEGADIEFSEFVTSRTEMRDRYALVKTTKRGVDRLSVAQAIIDAFTLIGGTPAFAIWAQENQGDFYRLYAKQAPALTDVNVKGEFVIRAPVARNPAFDGEYHELDSRSDQTSGGVARRVGSANDQDHTS